MESGIIEVIAPSPSFYPNFSKLHNTLGDDHQRVVWRSKQNLDFAFLMSYAQSKGTFYVQLEDDVIAKQNFITTMKSYALQKISKKENWYVLDFCQLGFIGEKKILKNWWIKYSVSEIGSTYNCWIFQAKCSRLLNYRGSCNSFWCSTIPNLLIGY